MLASLERVLAEQYYELSSRLMHRDITSLRGLVWCIMGRSNSSFLGS